ncbi:MAG TPA: carboxypeptidase-like regulatory domain-containing protein [Blastocatellia bacterium]|nr:carboxypeptidase-like regulatory domain-containing protein [Blastocatellia bacterium]
MHRARLLTVLLFFVATFAHAQTIQSTAPATASVTGQIKIGETPARGVSVLLISVNRQATPPTQAGAQTRTTTDADGRYKFANLPAGNFRVTVLSPGYIVFGTSDIVRNGHQIALKDGEAVERIDFTLTRGGVITGKVTSNTNRPIIGEPITLTQRDEAGKQVPFNAPEGVGLRTDDRGIYRAYGLPPGKYLVSAGRGDARGGPPGFMANRTYQRTFHPEATDETQATPVTVEAGKEVTEVDIRMASVETFAAAGRVVEAETGKPIAGVLIAHSTARGGGRDGQMQMPPQPGGTDGMSGNEGEFRIEGLARGRYSVYVVPDPQNPLTSEYYSEPATVEIATTDVTGLEIKLQRGASINGIVVLDGATDPNVLANVRISALSRGGGGGGGGMGGRGGGNAVAVAPNGMFRVAGLAPGRVSLNVSEANNPGPFSGLQILRIEKDGAELQSGLEVQQGEQVAGVRIHVTYGTSVIRGIVKIEGGALPQGMRLMVMARRTDGAGGGGGFGGRGGSGMMPAQVDAQGQFQIERLVPGTYEVSAQAMGGGFGGPGGGGMGGGFGGRGGGQQQGQPGQPPGQVTRVNPAAQTVVVGNNATQNVVLMLNVANLPAMTQPGNQPGNRNPQGGQPNNPARRRP